ncbi:MAG: hypothetical protein U0174_13925 [Polyangiaceae bacterium]
MKPTFLCGIALSCTLFSSFASAAPAATPSESPVDTLVLATDDVYDCAELPRGSAAEWVAATAGGLVIGRRVLTALDGLPDTRIESVRVEGARLVVGTRRGNVQVSLPDLRVMPGAAPGVPLSPESVRFLGPALLRAEHRGESRACFATDQGLRVAKRLPGGGWSDPERVGTSLSLPSANVAALAESDDALFIGTFDSGLFRRDKRGTLTPVDAKNPNINALHWDAKRRNLWVGTARGLVLCEQGVQCKRMGDVAGVHAVAPLGGGLVAAGGEGELSIYEADGTRKQSMLRKHGLPFRAVWALAKSKDGVLYVGTTSGLYHAPLARLLPTSTEKIAWKRASMVGGDLPDDWVTALAVDGDAVHVGTYNGGVVRFKRSAGELTREGAHPSLGYVNPAGITVLDGGEIAVATMSGLHVGNGAETGTFRKVATVGEDVTGVVRGKDGIAWIATRRGVMGRRVM